MVLEVEVEREVLLVVAPDLRSLEVPVPLGVPRIESNQMASEGAGVGVGVGTGVGVGVGDVYWTRAGL
jgi:hypothetical protein